MITKIAIIFTLCLLSRVKAATVIAENTFPSNASSWFNTGAGIGTDGEIYDNRKAQTFIPTSSGLLESISFNVHRQPDTNANLRISVTSMVEGQPTVTLATALLSFSSVGTSSISYAFLQSGSFSNTVTPADSVYLNAGVTYALVFSSDHTEANYRLYGYQSEYNNGTLMRFQNTGPYTVTTGSDLLFRVTATPIPESKTWLICGITIFLACLSRQRENT